MSQQAEHNLFEVLEELLKKKGKPQDCHDLFEDQRVRKLAKSPNRVSDYLGNLWRKGKVRRMPTGDKDNSRARWMYEWKEPEKLSGSSYAVHHNNDDGVTLLKKPAMEVTQHGDSIQIELPNLVITIRSTRR